MLDPFISGYLAFFDLPVALQLPFVAAFAGMLGSFINVCIWRIPRGESIVFPRSHCPNCQTDLGVPDLVPVFSYLFLRGNCRHCGVHFSPRYMYVELLLIAIWSACLLAFGMTTHFLFASALGSLGVTATGVGLMKRSMRRERSGFTFIGILLAMSLFVIFIGPFLDIARTGYVGSVKNRDYLIAYNLAREKLEQLRLIPARKLRSDWEIYVRGSRMTDNIFLDEFGPLARWGQKEEVFYENFSDVRTRYKKFPDSVQEKFERNYRNYYGLKYEFYPKGYGAYRRVTKVKDITDPSVPGMVLQKVTVLVTIDTKVTRNRVIEVSAIMSDRGP